MGVRTESSNKVGKTSLRSKFLSLLAGGSSISVLLLSRYAATGGAGALFSISGFAFLIQIDWWERHYLLAAATVFLVWSPVAFALQRHWVFDQGNSKWAGKFIAFFFATIPMHFLSIFLLTLLVEVGHIEALVSQVLTAGTVAFLQFLTSWLGIFREPKSGSS